MRCKACDGIMKRHEFTKILITGEEETLCTICRSAAFSRYNYPYDHEHIPSVPDGPTPPLPTYG